MSDQPDLFPDDTDDASGFLIEMLDTAPTVLVKKLSNNDRDWAKFPNKHQAGVYIPVKQRDGGFFPPLQIKEREADKPDIREAFFRTEWPQVDETKETRLVNYTSKGEETHMTGVPKEAFADLSPASFLVMARTGEGEQTSYRCLTSDSASATTVMLVDALKLAPDFRID